MSVHWGIVLQNYFHDQIEQYWFKDDHTRATSIQQSVQSDSIVALSQRSEEFCNTIWGEAVMPTPRLKRRA
jgi:hypothetical protein